MPTIVGVPLTPSRADAHAALVGGRGEHAADAQGVGDLADERLEGLPTARRPFGARRRSSSSSFTFARDAVVDADFDLIAGAHEADRAAGRGSARCN